MFLEVEPVPASRPRVSKWGVYYGKNYERFRSASRAFLFGITGKPMSGQIDLDMEIIVSPPKTTKRDTPRGDLDNYIKGPLDVMTETGTFWHDDDQIVKLKAVKRFAKAGETSGVRITYRNCAPVAPPCSTVTRKKGG